MLSNAQIHEIGRALREAILETLKNQDEVTGGEAERACERVVELLSDALDRPGVARR